MENILARKKIAILSFSNKIDLEISIFRFNRSCSLHHACYASSTCSNLPTCSLLSLPEAILLTFYVTQNYFSIFEAFASYLKSVFNFKAVTKHLSAQQRSLPSVYI